MGASRAPSSPLNWGGNVFNWVKCARCDHLCQIVLAPQEVSFRHAPRTQIRLGRTSILCRCQNALPYLNPRLKTLEIQWLSTFPMLIRVHESMRGLSAQTSCQEKYGRRRLSSQTSRLSGTTFLICLRKRANGRESLSLKRTYNIIIPVFRCWVNK